MDATAPPQPPPEDQRLHAASPESSRRGHFFRYHLARGFLEPTDTVLDAACGTGYGTQLLAEAAERVVGVDVDLDHLEAEGEFVLGDLREYVPDFEFDVFVGFETIEHLPAYEHYIEIAKRARRWIVLSAPVVPTAGLNPWHHHDFAPGQLAAMLIDEDWHYFQGLIQPAERSEIYVFARR